jgi:hypothetical protein
MIHTTRNGTIDGANDDNTILNSVRNNRLTTFFLI